MVEISLFLFLASFFFYMLPTIQRQLAAMQDSDYFYEKYIVFMKAQRKVESMWVMVAFIATSLLLQNYLALPIYLLLHTVVLTILGCLHLRKKGPKPRKEQRMTWLCVAAAFMFLTIFLILGIVFNRTFFWEMPFILMFLGFMTDTWILLGNWLVQPFEKQREKKACKAARTILNRFAAEREKLGTPPLMIIGVVGTYGKSGFIQIAKELLSKKYQVLASRPNRIGSLYNACEMIQSELTAEHDFLLLEIMARHPGDVSNYVKALPVNMGIVTSAAEKNLETFLSPERIACTLMEVAEGLDGKDSGMLPQLMLNYDDEQLRKQKVALKSFLRYGSYRGDVLPQHLDVWAKNLDCTIHGSSFTLCDHHGMEFRCTIPQVGHFYTQNAIAASALCFQLGFSQEEIQAALSSLGAMDGYPELLPSGVWPDRIRKRLAKPWESDSEETKADCPFRILDDSNEISLEEAKDILTVLSAHSGYRILLTRGLRGQGAKEDECNRLLGRQAARCSDAVIVVGKDKFALVEDGAQRGGFVMGDLHLALDLKDAVRRAKALAADQEGTVCVLTLGQF